MKHPPLFSLLTVPPFKVVARSLSAVRHLLQLLAVFTLGFTAHGNAQTPASNVQQFTLRNGMTLIVKPDHRAPTAVNMVWVRVGSMDEVDGATGVAHMLEHVLFKGTPTVPAGEFSRRVVCCTLKP